MSVAVRAKPYTICRATEQFDTATGQKKKTWQTIGQIMAFISPISRTQIDSHDRRFSEATDKLHSYDRAADLRETDQLTGDTGESYEVIWIDTTHKLLTATLKRQVFKNA